MPSTTFPSGVSAGDTDQTSTVLWTRSTVKGKVVFEVSTSPDFQTIIDTEAHAKTAAVPVKVEVDHLTPGTAYYYRVTNAFGDSEIGQFQTAGSPGAHGGLHFGVSGDWRGELAPYPAINNADDSSLDFFVKLGDTIYADFPSPAVPIPQAHTLEEFRAKHAEVYSTVSGLNAWADLQRTTSILAVIDDHEVTDDFAGGAPPSTDHRFDGSKAAFINDTKLFETGIRAFEEYNAIRDEIYDKKLDHKGGDACFAGELNLYRYNTYGDDAAVFVVDARSFRDKELAPANPTSPSDVARFLAESFDPTRTFLGHTQLEQLKHDLASAQEAGVTWKFVMLPEPIQNLGPLFAQDRYEGYAAERTELLSFINGQGIENVVFVTADLHGTTVNNLTYQAQLGGAQIPTSAFEIITGAVAYDAPLGPTVVNTAVTAGLLTAAQQAFYNLLPINNDSDSALNDKDDFVKFLGNQFIDQFQYDRLGLNENLNGSNPVDAILLQGDYVAAHTYGWTEFEIDPNTQQLLVTTWGIESYDRQHRPADPQNIIPHVVSQFAVHPHGDLVV